MAAIMVEVEQNSKSKEAAIPVPLLDDFDEYRIHPLFNPATITMDKVTPHARGCLECILRVGLAIDVHVVAQVVCLLFVYFVTLLGKTQQGA